MSFNRSATARQDADVIVAADRKAGCAVEVFLEAGSTPGPGVHRGRSADQALADPDRDKFKAEARAWSARPWPATLRG